MTKIGARRASPAPSNRPARREGSAGEAAGDSAPYRRVRNGRAARRRRPVPVRTDRRAAAARRVRRVRGLPARGRRPAVARQLRARVSMSDRRRVGVRQGTRLRVPSGLRRRVRGRRAATELVPVADRKVIFDGRTLSATGIDPIQFTGSRAMVRMGQCSKSRLRPHGSREGSPEPQERDR